MHSLITIIGVALLCRSARRLLEGSFDLVLIGPEASSLHSPVGSARWAVTEQAETAMLCLGLPAADRYAVGRAAEEALPL